MSLLDAIRSPGDNSTPAASAEYAHGIVNLFDDAIVTKNIRQVQ
jgi:hypothetical protein